MRGLTVLSVMAHGRHDVDQAVQIALAAIAGAERVSERDLSVLYFDLIDGYEFQSETLRKSVATTKAADVIAFLEDRALPISDEEQQRILACTDLKMLDQWIRRAGTVGSVEELFG